MQRVYGVQARGEVLQNARMIAFCNTSDAAQAPSALEKTKPSAN